MNYTAVGGVSERPGGWPLSGVPPVVAAGAPGLVNRRISGRAAHRVSVQVFASDVRVRRKMQVNADYQGTGGGLRGRIAGLSPAAKRRMLFTFRNVRGLTTLLTLTYPRDFPTNGREVKRHLAAFRRWLTHRGIGGLWVLEFQKRGAPHFHLFLNGEVHWEHVAQAWYRIVGSGDIRHLVAGTRIESLRETYAAASYAAKYAQKMEQKDVPEGFEEVGRFWGAFGGVAPEVVSEVEGAPEQIAPAVRVVRGIVNARQRSAGRRSITDRGRWSFVGYDAGVALAVYLDRSGLAPLNVLGNVTKQGGFLS